MSLLVFQKNTVIRLKDDYPIIQACTSITGESCVHDIFYMLYYVFSKFKVNNGCEISINSLTI